MVVVLSKHLRCPSSSALSIASFTNSLITKRLVDNPITRSFSTQQVAVQQNTLAAKKKSPQVEGISQVFRNFGHLDCKIDPLNLNNPKIQTVDGILNNFQSNDAQTVDIQKLQNIYCDKIGYEFSHLADPKEIDWITQYLEQGTAGNTTVLTAEEEKRALKLLLESEAFDLFMTKRFGQVKRYGLEGAETMIWAIDTIMQRAIKDNFDDLVIGMPHRGRLNLLVGLLEYPAEALFYKLGGNSEFPDEPWAMGDVISHIFQSSKVKSSDGQVSQLQAILLPNPSHLEAINPVALGVCRARSDLAGKRVLSLQLHGDAAFSGQGIVYESLSLSNLPGFTVSGTIHIVVNNQLGYTTIPKNGRSTLYATDIAKSINAPVIHVNAENPLQVKLATEFAYAYNAQFKKDVVIDLIGFRKWGHNELDEPSFTQPIMYKTIRSRPSIPQTYVQDCIKRGLIDSNWAENVLQTKYSEYDECIRKSKDYKPEEIVHWNFGLKQAQRDVSVESLVKAGQSSVAVPSTIKPHARLEKYHIESRLNALKSQTNEKKIDWATAEAMAFGTLLEEGHNVRLCGQDVGRGTFSQRHCQIYDQNSDSNPFEPLNNCGYTGKLSVVNSNLSEFAVMGYEYGYSTTDLNGLTVWEAQFGDFFNGAQIVIDTFISSGETKWLQQSGLVLLLPHGYDGAGPEHSSCRMERFLQLTDENLNAPFKSLKEINFQVVNPTTPAQYFHLLRRQLTEPFRKPLVVVGPKTLLRLPAANSSLDEMKAGTSFQPIIVDGDINSAEKIVFLSGKLFYDLKKEQTTRNVENIAFVRVEQLCPFPAEEIENLVLNKLNENQKLVWVQEECENMGAFQFIVPRIQSILGKDKVIEYVGRQASAAPATGIGSRYKKEQQFILNKCFE